MRLSHKVAIITGASGEIGRAIASLFAREGTAIVLVARSFDKFAELKSEMRLDNTLTIPCDVTQRAQIEKVVSITLDRFSKIDILVNNAGISGISRLQDIDEQFWDAVFNVNVKGVFLFSQLVAREMIQRGGGSIINIASQAGKKGEPFNSAYAASKFAVIGFTQSLAAELGPYNIRVNAVCPGSVDSQIMTEAIHKFAKFHKVSPENYRRRLIMETPLRRFATPEDVAHVVFFLASDEAEFITGASIPVTGGSILF